MKCYCPKCGHASDVSAADIRRQGGTVVCPQCLTTFQMPLAGGADDADDDTPPPIPVRRQKAAPKPKAAPRPRTATSRPSRQATTAAAPQRTATAATRRTTARKPAKTKADAQGSKAKFVLISIGITAAFFALYALVGLLFDKL